MQKLGFYFLFIWIFVNLSACSSTPEKAAEPAQQKTASLSGLDPNKVVIQGAVTYSEDRYLLGNLTLVVRLEDISKQDAPAELVAEDRHNTKGQIPLSFAIHYDKRELKVGHRYNLRAQIIDTNTGAIQWLSTQAYPYIPGLTKDINIKVRSYNSQVRKASQFQTFLCGKKQEKLTVLLIGNKIKLDFRGGKWILEKVPSASGVKYQSGRITFWMKGPNAFYLEADKPTVNCQIQP